MKKLIMLAMAVVACSSSFADNTGFTKNSTQLNALGSAWKSQGTTKHSLNDANITMGYGGEDISRTPRLALNNATA